MQRKDIPRVYEYQSSTTSHPVDEYDIKHQPGGCLVMTDIHLI